MTAAVTLASNASIMTEPTGTAPAYQCRAWVNFNGTGTVAIRASGNVSSITDNGVGTYAVNITNALPDTNYSIIGSARNTSVGSTLFQPFLDTISTTSSFAIVITNSNMTTAQDATYVCVSVFR
jgi:hypothetical protein